MTTTQFTVTVELYTTKSLSRRDAMIAAAQVLLTHAGPVLSASVEVVDDAGGDIDDETAAEVEVNS